MGSLVAEGSGREGGGGGEDTGDTRCPFIGGNGAIGVNAVSGEGNGLSCRGRTGGDGINGSGRGSVGRGSNRQTSGHRN